MSSEDITVESGTHAPSSGIRLRCSSFASTDIGAKRLHNEDAYLASNSKGLWAVADGMGGHDAGDLASRTLVQNLDRVIIPDALDDSVDAILQTIEHTNAELNQVAADTDAITTIGTTVAMLVAREQRGVVLWAGDSRVYRERDDALEPLTRDHSVVNDLLDKGVIESGDADTHPDSNMITRSIGINDELEVDSRSITVLPQDRYIICSDGLTGYVNDAQIGMLANRAVNPGSKDACKALIAAALEAGSSDNITVIVIDFVEAR